MCNICIANICDILYNICIMFIYTIICHTYSYAYSYIFQDPPFSPRLLILGNIIFRFNSSTIWVLGIMGTHEI